MEKKKKILRVSTIPLSLNLLLVGQLRMVNEKYELVAVSSPGKDLEEVAAREGVRTVELPMERRISLLKDLKSLGRMIRLIRKEKPWMVHSLTPKAGLVTMIAGKLCGVPVRVHTFTGLVFPTSSGLKRRLLMATDRLTCACATVVNPEGKGVAHDLERFHITRKPLVLIGNGNVNGIDMNEFSRSADVMQKAAAISQEGITTFCFVGRVVGDKGINELVSAFCRLYLTHPAIRLLLVGTFEEKQDPVSEETRRQIEQHPAITLTGWLNDVRPPLAASQIFVFPSYREGFPNVLMQAGAMDLPCIVTNINGSSEIITHGENGIIIPTHDEEALFQAMKHLLEDTDCRKKMAACARTNIAERYDRKEFWKALLDFYKNCENL